MEALGMMGVEFSLPFPPYHWPLRSLWARFLHFHPLPRYVNVPGLFGQPNIANILSWHYLWDPYGGCLGMMGVEFSLPFPPYHWPLRVCGLLGQFLHFHPLPRYVNVPGLFGQPNIANILSWHYLWDPYGGFGHDGSRIQPAIPSLPLTIASLWASGTVFALSSTSKICKCSWIVWPT